MLQKIVAFRAKTISCQMCGKEAGCPKWALAALVLSVPLCLFLAYVGGSEGGMLVGTFSAAGSVFAVLLVPLVPR